MKNNNYGCTEPQIVPCLFQGQNKETSFLQQIEVNVSSLPLMCFDCQSKKMSEQPCSNGEPIRHSVLWEEIRTVHNLILRVPHNTSDRTRTLVPWAQRHMVVH